MTPARLVVLLCGFSIGSLANVVPSTAAEDNAKPLRPWVVYLLPHSHVDIGYNGTQAEVERRHWRYSDQVLELCGTTAQYPPGARFKWNAEVLWPMDSYLRQASPTKRQQMIDAIRTRQNCRENARNETAIDCFSADNRKAL